MENIHAFITYRLYSCRHLESVVGLNIMRGERNWENRHRQRLRPFQNKVQLLCPVSPQEDVDEQQQNGVDVADVSPQRFLQQRVQFLVLVGWWNKSRTSGGQTADPERSSLPPRLWPVGVRLWAD